ncbi:MAG TPA: hypothetical protein VFB61_07195 [Gemmatimonadales bacterium]|nr:hypothetical protein [Gemmatimonadales bacterium]
MLKRLVRSTLAGLVSLCFAYSAITWGSMPGCVVSAGQSVHDSHGGGRSHQHSAGSDHRPVTTQCLVHLCCVQLASPAGDLSTQLRIATPDRATGPVLVSQLVRVRPAHTLPFAHAPPPTRG